MATKGNLELRLPTETLYASTTHDGYDVHKIVPNLVFLLDKNPKPNHDEFKEWFRTISKELLPERHYSEQPVGGIPCEVIIDVERRIILYTIGEGNEHSHQYFKKLIRKHDYQIFGFLENLE